MNMLDLLDRPIAYHRCFVWLGAGITGAVFLSQALYWTRRTNDQNGWFYKSQAEWEEETGLTRHEQDGARKKLCALGVLEEIRRGVPARLFYRLNMNRLREILVKGKPLKPVRNQDCRNSANWNAENQQARLPQTDEQDCHELANITENTTEITTETESKSVRADAPPTAEQKLSSSPHHGTGEHKKQTATKGTRLPDDWTLPDQWRTFAIGQGLSPQAITREADIFADYWRSIPGAKAVKLDWFATWRNWIRKIATQPVNQDHRRRASPPDSVSRPRAFGE